MADRLAGCDLVLEVSRDAIRNLLLARPELGEFVPPFEYERDIGPQGGGGAAYFAFHALDVLMLPGAAVRVRLRFDRSSVLGNGLLRSGAGRFEDGNALDLRGTLDLDVPVALAAPAGDPGARELVVALPRTTVTMTIERAEADRRNYGIIEGAVKDDLERTLRDEYADVRVSLPLRVDPERLGLNPLTVKDARLVTIAPPEPSRQSLAIFLDLAEAGGGDPSVRTESSIPPGKHVVLGLSPYAFHEYVFEPALVRLLRDPEIPAEEQPSDAQFPLPPTAGTADAVPYPALRPWELTYAADALRFGYIEIDVRARNVAENGAFGSTLDTRIIGKITPRIEGGAIAASWETFSAGAGQDFEWGWWVGAVLLPGLQVTMGLAHFGADALASANASAFAFQIGAQPLPVPLPGFSFTGVDVAPDGLEVTGAVVPRVSTEGYIAVAVDVTSEVEAKQLIEEGTYTSERLPQGTYGYTRSAQRERHTFRARVSFAARPYAIRWLVSGFEPPEEVSGRGRTVVSVETVTGPPGAIERQVRTDVEVGFEISDDGGTLTLRNRPEDGNYGVSVVCELVDHEGRRARAFAGAVVTGDLVEMRDGFDADFEAAVEALADAFGRYRAVSQPARGRLPTGPRDPGARVRTRLAAAVLSDPAAGALILSHAGIAGWDLPRALSADPAAPSAALAFLARAVRPGRKLSPIESPIGRPPMGKSPFTKVR